MSPESKIKPDQQPTQQPPDQKPKWTVMIFMGAATIEGEVPLIGAAEDDLKEMRYAVSGEMGETGETLEIFVQLHLGKDVVPRRDRITKNMPPGIDGLKSVEGTEVKEVQDQALESFIRASLKASGYNPNNPNHYTMLVLWGHAYDFAIGRAHTRDGTIDALDFAELSTVLERLQAKYGATKKLDILGFDACDLSTVEMACQLAPFSRYLLGSQIGIPIPGWPYDRLDRLWKPIGRLMGPAELGSYIVRRFCESYSAQSGTVSLTLLDLDRAPELFDMAGTLALLLIIAMPDAAMKERIVFSFAESQTAPGRPFVDVADLCFNLMRNAGDPLIAGAARALGDFLISPRPPLAGTSEDGFGRAFVVEHGRNASQTALLNGISIYAPHVAPDRNFDDLRSKYDNFAFAQKTLWSGLVHALAQ